MAVGLEAWGGRIPCDSQNFFHTHILHNHFQNNGMQRFSVHTLQNKVLVAGDGETIPQAESDMNAVILYLSEDMREKAG